MCSSELLVPTVVVLGCEETCLLLGLLQGRQNEFHEGGACTLGIFVCVCFIVVVLLLVVQCRDHNLYRFCCATSVARRIATPWFASCVSFCFVAVALVCCSNVFSFRSSSRDLVLAACSYCLLDSWLNQEFVIELLLCLCVCVCVCVRLSIRFVTVVAVAHGLYYII